MLLNEHQSKELLNEAGIPIPQGKLIRPDEIDNFEMDEPMPWIMKAQVLAGGRGKAGGIKKVDVPEEVAKTANKIFDLSIKGEKPPFIRVEPNVGIQREMYVSLTVSRPQKAIVFTVGKKGGVEVESQDQSNLLIQNLPTAGIRPHAIRAAFFHLGLEKEYLRPFADLISKLYDAFTSKGLLLAEINPLVINDFGEFLALDGKIEIDDNMVDIDQELNKHYHPEHVTTEEYTAKQAGLSFVPLKGWVGIIVNGAGLAMTTMDALNYSGLSAANFLDLGGGADQQRMETAFSLLFKDESVKILFVNLFGGILSCEKVGMAMKQALNGQRPPKPMVVRMSGFGAAKGREILNSLEFDNIHVSEGMTGALEIIKKLKPEGITIKSIPSTDTTIFSRPVNDMFMSDHLNFPIDQSTPILVQGITGREGRLHTARMLEYGSKVVAGVTPFKGGQDVDGVPVYNSVRQALEKHDIRVSIIFVPPKLAPDAILEAAEAGIPWVICITEGIVQQEMLKVLDEAKRSPSRIIGPNTPGIIVPGRTKIGIMPPQPFTPGHVAIVSRSGTLTYEASQRLSDAGIGQSVCIGIGGDPFIGTQFKDVFELLAQDNNTRAVLVLGEIGGDSEEDLARYVRWSGFSKPVTAFIAGRTAPEGKRLGHAGAILEKGQGVDGKLKLMRNAGFSVCSNLQDIPLAVATSLGIELER